MLTLQVSRYFLFALQGGIILLNVLKGTLQYIVLNQQTRNIKPMLAQCWADVVDGTTLVQHSVDVSCLLGRLFTIVERFVSQ